MNIRKLKERVRGDVLDDSETRARYSRDASFFQVTPQVVVFPRDVLDLKALVAFVEEERKEGNSLSLTPRAAGTDMTGGSIGESIIVGFEKYFNHMREVNGDFAVAEPGVFYRDFERETLKKGMIMPSFPASREICALGGMVSNNAGGEKTLKYGKTEKYVRELKMILSDGEEYVIKPLTREELIKKIKGKSFEAQIYKKMYKLIEEHYEEIMNARPKVSKNSAGYALWNVWDKEKGVFDLTKLIVGSLGTLGLLTEIKLGLVPLKKHSRMMAVFLYDAELLSRIVDMVLPYDPEAFESYDNNTFMLALRYFYSFAKLMGVKSIISLGLKFIPELILIATRGIPKLVLLLEFTHDNENFLRATMSRLEKDIGKFNVKVRILENEAEAQKYHAVRRESFNLLRQKIKNKRTAPFIDDIVVAPPFLSEFLPQLDAILKQYPLTYTLAGHVGDGNFHIIPLMNLKDEKERGMIPELMDKVYDLVLRYGGSLTGEHNDGLIRSPYLRKMFGDSTYKLFEEVKMIFDPHAIFNPGKKVGSDLRFALDHIRRD